MCHPVHLQTVAFKGATLGERFLTQVALVWSHTCGKSCNSLYLVSFEHTCMCPGVAFKIEGVVESLAAEGAKVALDVAVTFHVSIQESL